MKRSKFSEAQVAFILRQVDEGATVGEVCRKAGISEATFYVWRKKYAGLMPSEMKRLRYLLRRLRFLLSAAFDPRFYRVLETPAPHDKPVSPATPRLGKGSVGSKGRFQPGSGASQPGKRAKGAPKGKPSGKPSLFEKPANADKPPRGASQGDDRSPQPNQSDPSNSDRLHNSPPPQNPAPQSDHRAADPAKPINVDTRLAAKPAAHKPPADGKPMPGHRGEPNNTKPPQTEPGVSARQASQKPKR